MPCGAKFDRNSIFHPYNGILDNSSMQSELSFFNQEIVAGLELGGWLVGANDTIMKESFYTEES